MIVLAIRWLTLHNCQNYIELSSLNLLLHVFIHKSKRITMTRQHFETFYLEYPGVVLTEMLYHCTVFSVSWGRRCSRESRSIVGVHLEKDKIEFTSMQHSHLSFVYTADETIP